MFLRSVQLFPSPRCNRHSKLKMTLDALLYIALFLEVVRNQVWTSGIAPRNFLKNRRERRHILAKRTHFGSEKALSIRFPCLPAPLVSCVQGRHFCSIVPGPSRERFRVVWQTTTLTHLTGKAISASSPSFKALMCFWFIFNTPG